MVCVIFFPQSNFPDSFQTRKYADNVNDKLVIRNPRSKCSFRGTAKYASLSNHTGREQCRKDDVESWLYQQVELTRGKLPWRNIKVNNWTNLTLEQNNLFD